MMSFAKEKMAPIKAIMALIIVADHLGLFYGISAFKPFIELGAPIVSVFFFISGYGLHISYQNKGDNYLKHFFSHRFWKVLAPYLLATLLFVLLFWSSEEDFKKAICTTFSTGVPILPFSWFALEILFFYLAFYISFRLFPREWKIIGLCFLVVVLIIVFYVLGYSNGWWISSLAFPAGVIFAKIDKRLFSAIDKHPGVLWLSILVLIAVFFVSYLSGRVYEKYYVWTISHVCIVLTVSLLVSWLPLERLNSTPIAFLAKVSYEVYLCQGIAMQLLRGKFFVQNDVLFVFLVYTVTIILAWGIHLISQLVTRKPCTSSTT